MNKKSKIYIAGHTGLVGSAFLRNLQKKGYTNLITRSSKELDLRRQQDVEAFFASEKPELVFLCAAKVGGILANISYPAEFIYNNLMISANIINSARLSGVKKLMNLGTSCIYPCHADQPIKEESLLSGPLEPTNEPYSIAKISAIKLCRYYNEQFGTNFISVMPTNIYGPGDNFCLETAHVIPALIRKFHIARLLQAGEHEKIESDIMRCPVGFGIQGYEAGAAIENLCRKAGLCKDGVTVWGRGDVRREFLYVDDLAEACVFLMENYGFKEIGELINVGTGEEISIKDLAKIIKDAVGFSGKIKYDLAKPEGMSRKLLDVSKIKRLGWKPVVCLEEGIKDRKSVV